MGGGGGGGAKSRDKRIYEAIYILKHQGQEARGMKCDSSRKAKKIQDCQRSECSCELLVFILSHPCQARPNVCPNT